MYSLVSEEQTAQRTFDAQGFPGWARLHPIIHDHHLQMSRMKIYFLEISGSWKYPNITKTVKVHFLTRVLLPGHQRSNWATFILVQRSTSVQSVIYLHRAMDLRSEGQNKHSLALNCLDKVHLVVYLCVQCTASTLSNSKAWTEDNLMPMDYLMESCSSPAWPWFNSQVPQPTCFQKQVRQGTWLQPRV